MSHQTSADWFVFKCRPVKCELSQLLLIHSNTALIITRQTTSQDGNRSQVTSNTKNQQVTEHCMTFTYLSDC